MPLTMRPSGLASTGYYKDHANYLIFWVTRADGFISGHITGIALSASARSRSFRFDPGILDHIGPFDELDLNELPEFFRRA